MCTNKVVESSSSVRVKSTRGRVVVLPDSMIWGTGWIPREAAVAPRLQVCGLETISIVGILTVLLKLHEYLPPDGQSLTIPRRIQVGSYQAHDYKSHTPHQGILDRPDDISMISVIRNHEFGTNLGEKGRHSGPEHRAPEA